MYSTIITFVYKHLDVFNYHKNINIVYIKHLDVFNYHKELYINI